MLSLTSILREHPPYNNSGCSEELQGQKYTKKNEKTKEKSH